MTHGLCDLLLAETAGRSAGSVARFIFFGATEKKLQTMSIYNARQASRRRSTRKTSVYVRTVRPPFHSTVRPSVRARFPVFT